MSTPRTWRVLVRTGQIHAIDIGARSEEQALTRAEKLWHGGRSERFDCVHHKLADLFEIDEVATDHLAEVANEDRAQWAENALKTFSRETGSDMGREALHDLLCDLGHYADQLGLDFDDEMRRAAETWSEEKAEEQREGAQP